MARPTRKTVTSGLEGWDADMDDNFAAIMDTPFPPAEYANQAAFPSASLYEGCIARSLADDMLFVERGGEWVPLAPTTKYSTSEKDSGQVWTDGSTIYQKTIELGALPNATSTTDAHSISNLDRIIKIEGMADDGTDQIPLPYYHATDGVEVSVDDTNITLVTEDDKSGFTGHITIYYLKSS